MPVLNLSDRQRDNRIGHIRLGIRDPERDNAPREIDHFLLDPNTGDSQFDNRLKREFVDLYGDTPTRIQILLPPLSEEQLFPVWRVRYGGKKKICQGNGDAALNAGEAICRAGHEGDLKVLNDEPPNHVRVQCMGSDCPFTVRKHCRVSAVLKVILPDLPTLGIWWIVTGSYNSIVNIQSALRNLKGLLGSYSRIPLILMRQPQQIEHDGQVRVHHVLQIDMQSIGYNALVRLAQKQLKAEFFLPPLSRRDEPLDILDSSDPTPGRLLSLPPAPVTDPGNLNGPGKAELNAKFSQKQAQEPSGAAVRGGVFVCKRSSQEEPVAAKSGTFQNAKTSLKKLLDQTGWHDEDKRLQLREWFGIESIEQVTDEQAAWAIRQPILRKFAS